MKKLLILMLGLVATTASFASTSATHPLTTQNRLIMTAEHKIKFYVQPLQTKGKLVIWDANGQVVYNQAVDLQKGLSQQFDLSNLSVGTYHLTLMTGTETLTKTFVMQDNSKESFVVQES
ncbi:T9SS type A sorting domain-containing protein [Spirosoma flavum]|uniref:T9SS type A sorting domain-containing protein n=1 Tax=Spirosoma flavum TaxID=2048557 RepID=A0ABW6AL61_9BACT